MSEALQIATLLATLVAIGAVLMSAGRAEASKTKDIDFLSRQLCELKEIVTELSKAQTAQAMISNGHQVKLEELIRRITALEVQYEHCRFARGGRAADHGLAIIDDSRGLT